MFTPHVRPQDSLAGYGLGTGNVPTSARADDNNNPPTANRVPSGSILFPATHLPPGRSPMLPSASPAHVPFTLQTPGLADPLASVRPTPVADKSAPFTGSALFPSGLPAATPASAAAPPPMDERPPLQSLLDVAPAAPAAASTSAPAAPTPSLSGAATVGAAALPAALGGHWVTAFGYHSTAMLGALLDELRPSGGEVVQHRLGSGPWVHVRFADARSQQQALAKNGLILHGSMIGVVEGIHPAASAAAMADGAAAGRSSLEPSSSAAATGIPLRIQQTRTVGPILRAPPVARRELGKAGWWTRLCEYVFGW